MTNQMNRMNKKYRNMNSSEKQNKQEEELIKQGSDALQNEEEAIDHINKNQETSTQEALLTKKLEEANTQIEDLNDKYLRLSAEFDNYRKRTVKEKSELIKNGGAQIIESILPILDDLERAIQTMSTSDDVEAMRRGVELIYNKFLNILEQNGLKKIDLEDKEFNTDYCEAIATLTDPSGKLKGKIMECIQPGYKLNDKVIRHAKVVVGE